MWDFIKTALVAIIITFGPQAPVTATPMPEPTAIVAQAQATITPTVAPTATYQFFSTPVTKTAVTKSGAYCTATIAGSKMTLANSHEELVTIELIKKIAAPTVGTGYYTSDHWDGNGVRVVVAFTQGGLLARCQTLEDNPQALGEIYAQGDYGEVYRLTIHGYPYGDFIVTDVGHGPTWVKIVP